MLSARHVRGRDPAIVAAGRKQIRHLHAEGLGRNSEITGRPPHLPSKTVRDALPRNTKQDTKASTSQPERKQVLLHREPDSGVEAVQ